VQFFNNSAINRTYVHAGLQTFAENVGGVFVFVYLLKAGLTVPIVFTALAAIFFLRIAIRQSVVPVVKRIGLRNGLIFGTLLVAASYLLVAQVQGVGPMLFFFVVFDALSTSFYWTCYHSYVATLGDSEHRGAQVSVREAINAIMGITAPLIGSFLLVFVGKGSAFLVAACVEALAVLPLLNAPNHRIADYAVIDASTKKYSAQLFCTDGVITAFFFFTWIIALFQTLGENFGAYGGTLALAGLIGAVMSLVMGRLIDLGHHKRSVQIAYGAIALSIAIKAFAYATPWMAIAATAFGAVASPLYMPVLMARVYNMAKASACPLRFQVAAEGAWDLGTGMGCLAAAALTWMGFSYFWPLLLGLVGAAAGYQIISGSLPPTVIPAKVGTHS
jgi:MFS transporter, DHA1 family, inner membrane transport protein